MSGFAVNALSDKTVIGVLTEMSREDLLEELAAVDARIRELGSQRAVVAEAVLLKDEESE